MLRRVSLALLVPFVAACLLAACDGEKVDYKSDELYDIDWIWKAGVAATGEPGVYGSLGVAANTSHPGARAGATTWRDDNGNFWLFGGHGRDANGAVGELNDLWVYTGTQWAWMGGSALVNANGTYGAQGQPLVENVPGARAYAVSWTDTLGNLYLFGGRGYDDAGTALRRLNDLWKFNGTQWSWVGGPTSVNAAGVYGTQGTTGATNWPGARHDAAAWVAADGTFWLFGGDGYDGGTGSGELNDLWRYSTTTNEWTWMKGSASVFGAAVYGTQGTAEVANTPGARAGMVVWADNSGNAWLLGGVGKNATNQRVVSDELWKLVYFAEGPQWSWVSGGQAQYVAPSYGTRGVASTDGGTPGSRNHATAWTTTASGATNSTLWLFGGDVETAEGVITHPNDLWRYDSGYWTWVGGKNTNNPAGNYDNIGLPGQPGGRAGAASWIDTTSSTLWLFGGDDHADLWFYIYSH